MKVLVILIFSVMWAAQLLGQTNNFPVSTLNTPSYKITIEVRCPEGETACENVKYVGVSKKTGDSITLVGKEIHSIGPDGITPAHFLGYEFKNGGTKYFLGEDGELEITRGSKVLVEEHGTWDW